MKVCTELGEILEQYAHDWQYKEPLGTIFKIGLYEYLAKRLNEEYEVRKK